MSVYKLNNNYININKQITINDVTYPRGDLLLRRDEWPTLGITEEADPLPTQAELDAQHNASILAQIRNIEQGQDRAIREVALGMTGSIARLQAIEDSIVALRAQFV